MVYSNVLGVSAIVLKAWRAVHGQWRFKAPSTTGIGHGMRLTGQATTALGNVIVNMMVHNEFTYTNLGLIQLGLFLGDDMIYLMKHRPSLVNFEENMKCNYNMVTKPELRKGVGLFCRLVVYNGKISAECGPDFVRLRNRYEFTNGQHEATSELMM